jgi:mannosyltransferase OCH1-like enzyme
MRRGLLIFLLINLLILSLLVRSVSTLLSLLVEDAAADAIHRAELPSPNSSLIEQRPQIIPKIIHQTYKNETIPEVWVEAQQSCIDLHPDYEYILWTNEKSRDFIAAEYPWFLETFDGYKYPIQRADSIRYFVLAHYGGTYIDLDDVRIHLPLILLRRTLTIDRAAIVAWIPSSHTPRGCAALCLPVSQTMRWALCLSTPSSSA